MGILGRGCPSTLAKAAQRQAVISEFKDVLSGRRKVRLRGRKVLKIRRTWPYHGIPIEVEESLTKICGVVLQLRRLQSYKKNIIMSKNRSDPERFRIILLSNSAK